MNLSKRKNIILLPRNHEKLVFCILHINISVLELCLLISYVYTLLKSVTV